MSSIKEFCNHWFTCLRFHLLQVLRGRLLVLWFLFSLFMQYGLVSLLSSAIIEFQQAQTILGLAEVVTALLYAQFFAGAVLAVVYGIWVVPYLHEESRAALTYALPVDKWVFPLTYACGFAFLYLPQALGLVLSLTIHFGPGVFVQEAFSFRLWYQDTLLSLLALQVWVFLLAALSLSFGKVPAFLGGAFLAIVLQVSAAIFNAGFVSQGIWFGLYAWLPPLGEMAFHLKGGFSSPGVGWHAALLVFWLVALAAVFRLRLQRA